MKQFPSFCISVSGKSKDDHRAAPGEVFSRENVRRHVGYELASNSVFISIVNILNHFKVDSLANQPHCNHPRHTPYLYQCLIGRESKPFRLKRHCDASFGAISSIVLLWAPRPRLPPSCLLTCPSSPPLPPGKWQFPNPTDRGRPVTHTHTH